jgi:hypothetical protein
VTMTITPTMTMTTMATKLFTQQILVCIF